MGVACGVTKRTQIHYEKDEVGASAAYLALAHDLGIDVAYVLVGKHERLSTADAELLDAWRAAPAPARAAAMTALTGGVSHASTLGAAPRTQFNDTSIGQQFSGDVDLRGQKLVVKRSSGTKKPTR
ncbi:XRE family transcriptional regulator [Stenotrophomonas maltophilia]|nr:XRE family transcriptional regulator [Stenotrophomonas maltophilia]